MIRLRLFFSLGEIQDNRDSNDWLKIIGWTQQDQSWKLIQMTWLQARARYLFRRRWENQNSLVWATLLRLTCTCQILSSYWQTVDNYWSYSRYTTTFFFCKFCGNKNNDLSTYIKTEKNPAEEETLKNDSYNKLCSSILMHSLPTAHYAASH